MSAFTKSRFGTMMIEDKIALFRDALLYTAIPPLMKNGGQGLTAPDFYPKDGDGNAVIPTQEIIDFFFSGLYSGTTMNSKDFFKLLHSLFTVFFEGIETFTFDTDARISEQEIQDADNRRTVECLTTNLIISFFANVRSYDGEIDTSLLEDNLSRLIKISNSGRDYRPLVENTLKVMVTGLKDKQSWRQCLQNIKEAELVCNLVGERLPKIDPSVLSVFFQEAQKELAGNNLLLRKIHNTKNQLPLEGKETKKYLKAAAKLEATEQKVLQNIDGMLGETMDFVNILGMDLSGLLQEQATALKVHLAMIFFGYADGKEKSQNHFTGVIQESYAAARRSMNRLYAFPNLCRVCALFRDAPEYRPQYTGIQLLYFKHLNQLLDKAVKNPDEQLLSRIRYSLIEWEQMITHLGREKEKFRIEEMHLQKRYFQLIGTVQMEFLKDVINLSPGIQAVSQAENHKFLESVRSTLLIACFESLMALQPEPGKTDAFKKEIQKILFSYSEHFAPRRFFYQNFFETCLGMIGDSTSHLFQNLTRTHQVLAKELATLFSDPRATGQFLLQSHRDHARKILEELDG